MRPKFRWRFAGGFFSKRAYCSREAQSSWTADDCTCIFILNRRESLMVRHFWAFRFARVAGLAGFWRCGVTNSLAFYLWASRVWNWWFCRGRVRWSIAVNFLAAAPKNLSSARSSLRSTSSKFDSHSLPIAVLSPVWGCGRPTVRIYFCSRSFFWV